VKICINLFSQSSDSVVNHLENDTGSEKPFDDEKKNSSDIQRRSKQLFSSTFSCEVFAL